MGETKDEIKVDLGSDISNDNETPIGEELSKYEMLLEDHLELKQLVKRMQVHLGLEGLN